MRRGTIRKGKAQEHLEAKRLTATEIVSGFRYLLPITLFFAVFLTVTWFMNLGGDREKEHGIWYLLAYLNLFVTVSTAEALLLYFQRDIQRHHRSIYVVQAVFAVFLPIWAALVSLADGILHAPTFNLLIYACATMVIIGSAYVEPMLWVLIQLAAGVITAFSVYAFGMEELGVHFLGVAAFAGISIVAGWTVFRSKKENHLRQEKLMEIAARQERYAYQDGLTGLPNRRAYQDRLNRLEQEPPTEGLILMILDLNGLKQTNDEKGHQAGDELIIGAAEVIQGALGSIGDVYRIGGDEFSVILMVNFEQLGVLLDELELRIRNWCGMLNDHLSISWGYSMGSDYLHTGRLDITAMEKRADEMMYRNKAAYYERTGMERRRKEREMALEQEKRFRSLEDTINAMEYDELTGLYNRQGFYRHAGKLLQQNPEVQYDLLVSDIENFHRINELYGYEVGNQVLQHIGSYLRMTVDSEVLAGRYGGDMFISLMRHNPEFNDENLLSSFFAIANGGPIKQVITKFGIYDNVDHELPVSSLCDRALMALRSVKHQYGQVFGRFDEGMLKEVQRNTRIEQDMKVALDHGQFQVYYQPKFSLAENTIIGAEALIRWVHPELGRLSPMEFIPVFEQTGFIQETDFYVWQRTCANLKQWQAEGIRVVPVSVNASRRDFRSPRFLARLAEAVQEAGIQTRLLHLEVTESVFSENEEELAGMLRQFRESGFAIELDDFGKGFSSLNLLAALPLDVLKLDQGYLSNLSDDKRMLVLKATVDLARSLNMKTIAEGVETEEQISILKQVGADAVQGYYYAKPMPEEEFEKYLAEGSCFDIAS